MSYDQITVALYSLIILVVPKYRQSLFAVGSVGVPQKRIYRPEFDMLKGVAIIAVVVIHSVYFGVGETDSFVAMGILHYFNAIARFAIGAFLLISGFLLAVPVQWNFSSLIHFYGKKILRILIPYGIITYGVWILFGLEISYWWAFLSGSAALPLYFVPLLFQLYMVYPFLIYIGQRHPETVLWGSFICSQIFFWLGGASPYYGIVFFPAYLYYFMFGIVQKSLLYPSRWQRRAWLEMCVLYAVLHFGFTLALGQENVNNDFATHTYNSQFLYSVAVSGLLLYWIPRLTAAFPVIQKNLIGVGKLSLWVFLLHYPIQAVLSEFMYQGQFFWRSVTIHFILTWVLVIPSAYICKVLYNAFIQQIHLVKNIS